MPLTPLTPASPTPLANLSILITGGSSGLGLSTATYLAQHGAHVTIADVQDGTSIASSLTTTGPGHVQYTYADVTNYSSLASAFELAVSFSPTKTLDCVLSFAGVLNANNIVDHVMNSVGGAGKTPNPQSLAAIDVNVKGTVHTSTLALHYLNQNKSPKANKSLVIVTSLAGYTDSSQDSIYTTSKYATRGFFRAIRDDAKAKLGIRVNAMAPYAMRTPMIEAGLKMMEAAGYTSGISLVEHDILVQAVVRCVVDESISGRSFAIVPEGAVDLGDDLEGEYAGPVLKELMARRKEAGDFLHR